MNDSPNGLSVLLIIAGCAYGCSFCFNKKLWNQKNTDFFVYKEIIDKHDLIQNFVLGGGDILLHKNREIVKNICNYLYQKNRNISLQVSVQSLRKGMSFLNSLNVNSIQLNLNNATIDDLKYYGDLIYLCGAKKIDLINRLVYLENEDEIEIPFSVSIDELQIDYNSDESITYNKAKDYAKKMRIPVLISKVNGRENVL